MTVRAEAFERDGWWYWRLVDTSTSKVVATAQHAFTSGQAAMAVGARQVRAVNELERREQQR